MLSVTNSKTGKKQEKDKIENLIELLLARKDSSGVRLVKKYNREWLLEVLNGDMLQVIEKKFRAHEDKGLDIVDFVKILLSVFEHAQDETIYIVLELIEFFKGICESQNLKDVIRFKDFTNYIVEEYVDNNDQKYTLQPKRMPEPSNFMNAAKMQNQDKELRIREIDLDPPEIHGRNTVGLKRIVTDKIQTDSTHHKNGEIKKAIYSPTLKMMFTLDSLCDYINIYDKNCKFDRKIKPEATKKNRDLIITNFNFSEKTQRLGACLKNYTLSFWEASDNFTFEKIISTSTASISELQINIWYVDFLDTWITTDKNGMFHLWDLLNHKVVKSFHILGKIGPQTEVENQEDLSKRNKGGSLASKTKSRSPPREGSTSNIRSKGSLAFNKKSNINFTSGISKATSKVNDKSIVEYASENSDQEDTNKNDPILSNSTIPNKGEVAKKKNLTKTQRRKENEAYKDLMSNNKEDIVHYLLEITEIAYIKLLALASTDKHIRIWELRDINKPKIIFCLNLVKGGVHQVRFFNSYQVLLVAGYENSIPVFSITPKYYDVNVVGRLVGHVSIITAMDVVEGTPMVITADDTGTIKTWDIRLCHCYQTIELSHKTIICQLLTLGSLSKIAFIGCRVNFLSFDKYDRGFKSETKQLIPIKAELNLAEEEIVVCTNSDLRFIDINTGKVKKIYAHLIDPDSSDELSVFRLLHKNHRFLLGDPKGDIMIFSYANGEKLNRLESHSHEVVDIKIDNYNKLIVSAGADSKIIIQREKLEDTNKETHVVEQDQIQEDFKNMTPDEILHKIQDDYARQYDKVSSSSNNKQVTQYVDEGAVKKKSEILRTINNVHHKNEIVHLALSVYHNLIATASFESNVYIYEYEFGKFMTMFLFDENTQVSAMEFITGLGILIVCTNDGLVHFIEQSKNKGVFKRIGYISLNLIDEAALSQWDSQSQKPTIWKLADDHTRPKKRKNSESSVKSSNPKESSVPSPSPEKIENSIAGDLVYAQKIYCYLGLKGEHKDIEELRKMNTIDTESIMVSACEVYFTLQNGYISVYDLSEYLKTKKILKHANTRQNYNPFRTNNEDCASIGNETRGALKLQRSLITEATCLNSTLRKNFFAHKDGVTSISIIKVPEEYILTTGNDKYMKIISKSGECLCAVNVNHPLPLKWSLKFDSMQDVKGKILFSLKVIQAIFKRYYNMLYIEGKIFDLKGFIKQYNDLEDGSADENPIFKLTQVTDAPQKAPLVMADEYVAKDFAMGKLRDVYRQELAGPSLKQLESKRRLILAQEEWKEEEQRTLDAIAQRALEIREEKPSQPAGLFDIQENRGEQRDSLKLSERAKRFKKDFKHVEEKAKNISTLPKESQSSAWSHLMSEVKQPFFDNKDTNNELSSKHGLHLNKKVASVSNTQTSFINYALVRDYAPKIGYNPTALADSKSVVTLPDSVKSVGIKKDKQKPMVVDFSEEAKVKRMQQAVRESNKERTAFREVVQNLNSALRQSQFGHGIPRRTGSLPQIKTKLNPNDTATTINDLSPLDSKPTFQNKNSRYFMKKKPGYNLLNS